MDRRTFALDVTHVGDANKDEYLRTETIRIVNTDSPQLNDPGIERTRLSLQDKLLGKEVRCYVRSRDTYHRVVAEIEVLKQKEATA
jgi:endonuclease YncB( thermonuclease family)